MDKRQQIAPRKQPRQERSRQMMADILEAAARVLAQEGLESFNTNRVAQVAGVSVGSLYQYFPNKESLLFQLQAQEAEQTWSAVDAILSDGSRSHRDRLTAAIQYFFETEREELPIAQLLEQAAIFFHQTPERQQLGEKASRRLKVFLAESKAEAQPPMDDLAAQDALQFQAQLITTMVPAIACRIRPQVSSPEAMARWATACSDMLCNYLEL